MMAFFSRVCVYKVWRHDCHQGEHRLRDLLKTAICHEIVDSENQAACVEHYFLFLVIPSISLEGRVTIIGS